jgi:hypothetical protein
MRVPAIIMPRFESLLQCSGAMQISLSVPLPATSTPSATPCCHCHSTFSRRPLTLALHPNSQAGRLGKNVTARNGGPMVLVPCNRAGLRGAHNIDHSAGRAAPCILTRLDRPLLQSSEYKAAEVGILSAIRWTPPTFNRKPASRALHHRKLAFRCGVLSQAFCRRCVRSRTGVLDSIVSNQAHHARTGRQS